MENALQGGLQTSQEFLSVWTTYCDVIRRKIDWSAIDEGLIEKLRAVFDRAIQHLLKCKQYVLIYIRLAKLTILFLC